LVAASGGRTTSDGFAVGSTLELVRRAEEGSAPQLFVHTLDALLLPPSLRTVREELLLDGSFASFLHACDGAGLGWVLSAVGPLTVLAVDESGFSTGLGARINTSLARGAVDAAREGPLRSAPLRSPSQARSSPRGFRRCTRGRCTRGRCTRGRCTRGRCTRGAASQALRHSCRSRSFPWGLHARACGCPPGGDAPSTRIPHE
jgi:hypothetical protein